MNYQYNPKSFLFIIIFSIISLSVGFAQETAVQLPTNDNTSSFNVTKNNGTSVMKVDGSGRITGDGSGLSNVKSKINYAQGNMHVNFREGLVPGLNLYEAQILREVTINCPGPGIILAEATGYADWESKNEDLLRIWMYPHPTVSPVGSWETPDFHNLRIVSDYQCADSSDQYTTWSISKLYTVGSAQNYTVKVCADKPFTSSTCLIGDVVLSLIFFPTGGTGEASPSIVSSPEPELILPDPVDLNSVDGSPPGNRDMESLDIDNGDEVENRISVLEADNEALRKRLLDLEQLINEIKSK